VRARRLNSTALEKVWGTPETEPWYPHGAGKIGEVWFSAPEEPRLLVKFLFTSEKLSVQVHPPDSASGRGKTEMWHVLRAAPGARVALGFERRLDREEARAAAISGEIEALLRWYAAYPGDTFIVPAGTVHAIGAGLALCEIQQHSDVTYRLYDYGRPRELHLDKAVQVAFTEASSPKSVMLPIDCQYFHTELARTSSPLLYKPAPARFHVLIFITGMGTIAGQPFQEGEAWLVPAGGRPFEIEPSNPLKFLRVWVP